MKRAIEIARKLNIGMSNLEDYFIQIDIKLNGPNQKIDTDIEDLLFDLHNDNYSFVKKTIHRDNVQIIKDDELPDEFKEINPFDDDQLKLIGGKDTFENRVLRIIEIKEEKVESIFTDFEAFSICLGLDDGHLKFIARKFFNSQEVLENIVEAHIMAMLSLEKYGSKLLAYVISLPSLPFKAFDVTQIFSELDKRKRTQNFPIIRILFKNERGQGEKIQISFYAEKNEKGRLRNENLIIVTNKTTGKKLMQISRNGYVIPQGNCKQIIPVLQLFVRFSKDTKAAILNYGLETGECSVCGRELTDSKSIKYGIGPICAKYVK